MTHDHTKITFDGPKGIVEEECPECGRTRWLGTCGDGCRMCQSCFHRENELAPLPSDMMRRTDDRIAQCVKLGLVFVPREDAYIKGHVYVPILDIKVMEDEAWHNLIEKIKSL